MMSTRRMAGLIACLAALAGCGSGTALLRGSSTPETGRSAAQIVIDAGRAVGAARGYVIDGWLRQDGQLLTLRVVVAHGDLQQLAVTASGVTERLLVLDQGAYLEGNRAFWDAHLGSRGDALAGRWLQIPLAEVPVIAGTLGRLQPRTLARCLVENHGTLSRAGRATVDGRSAIVVRDAGDAPGSAPGTLAVAASGIPYPLQVTQSGDQRAGGPIDVCNDGQADSSRGVMRFSHWGAPPAVAVPAHPLVLHNTASV
jgi:hypothetical protein